MQLTNEEGFQCLEYASHLIQSGRYKGEIDMFQLAEVLEKNFIEKKERELLIESSLDYNDEIVYIESVGDKETIDIAVSGDNLFMCNGILTKNSMGLTHTLDMYLAQMAPEELKDLNQMMFKQLKNRYNDPDTYKRFVVGFDRPKMTFYNVESSAQEGIVGGNVATKRSKAEDDKPVFDSSSFGSRMRDRGDFGSFNFE